MTLHPLLVSISLSLAASLPIFAKKLGVGDTAPALEVGSWVQGEPLTGFDKEHVYVVEFWATWCGPCKATIPHLDEMHEALKDKGVVFIGQNVMEQEETKVSPFVKEMGEKMSYRVALDAKKPGEMGAMATLWMEAAEQQSIPFAFVVDKEQKIVWTGHPGELTAAFLTEVVDGKYPVAKAVAEAAEKEKKAAATQALMAKVGEAVKLEDWRAALAALDEVEKADASTATRFIIPRLQFNAKLGETPTALKIAEAAMKGELGKNPLAVCAISRLLLTESRIVTPEVLASTQKWSEDALAALPADADVNIRASVLGTQALCQFQAGKKDEAVKTAEAALTVCKNERLLKELTATVEAYKAGKLPGQLIQK